MSNRPGGVTIVNKYHLGMINCVCLHKWVDVRDSVLCCRVNKQFDATAIPNRLHGAAINAEGDAI